MEYSEARKRYLKFFQKRKHAIVPSASLVPINDPTTLFTGSGMQPMVPFLLGEAHPKGSRIVDLQKCFRAEDIEEIGDNRHTTFFEMMGNWSFGDYFRKEQLSWYFEFLTDEMDIDPKKLYVTVFAGDKDFDLKRDDEAISIWKKLFAGKGIEAKDIYVGSEEHGANLDIGDARIFQYTAKKNWWSRAGIPKNMPVGEMGGPNSEVFFDFGTPHDTAYGKYCHPNCDCGRFVELGNSVFITHLKTDDGNFVLLPKKNVDFGGGIERLVAIANKNPDIFSINIFQGVIAKLEELSGKSYDQDKHAFRIIVDHIRGALFMIVDGVVPSNTEQGYFLRRLLRRMIVHADRLTIPKYGLIELPEIIAVEYKDVYPELVEKISYVQKIFREEEERFRVTLTKGLKEFKKLSHNTSFISGHDAFILFSTYGFPLEITIEFAEECGITVDEEAFHEEMKKHQEESRKGVGQKFKGGLADNNEKITMLHTTTHLMLAGLRKYLGKDVHQAGSNITVERTRFDFTHSEKVSREILNKVEEYVNRAIQNKCNVITEQIPKEKAKEQGVEGSFWEKYPDTVNVYSVVCSDGTVYSKELCGGPHVKNTKEIKGTFKIKKEEASSAGVRRIKAILEE